MAGQHGQCVALRNGGAVLGQPGLQGGGGVLAAAELREVVGGLLGVPGEGEPVPTVPPQEGGVRAIVAAIFTDEQSINGTALRQACEQIAALQAEARESPGTLRLCATYADLMDAAA